MELVETPSGVPPGSATNDAPVTFADGDAIAWATVSAFDDGVIVACAPAVTPASTSPASTATSTSRDTPRVADQSALLTLRTDTNRCCGRTGESIPNRG